MQKFASASFTNAFGTDGIIGLTINGRALQVAPIGRIQCDSDWKECKQPDGLPNARIGLHRTLGTWQLRIAGRYNRQGR